MNKLSKNLIQKIGVAYQIGKPLSEPAPLMGGFLHSCWKFETETGFYVVKKINPALSNRKNQFRLSEEISSFMPKSISALQQNGDFIFSDQNEVVLVFPYIEASILKPSGISNGHIHEISKTLSTIHDQKMIIEKPAEVEIFSQDISYWKNCHIKLYARSIGAAKNLSDQLSTLENIHAKYLSFIPILKQNLIISHRDMDPKNVLWDSENNHYVIDWESAGLINKTKDLMATAIYWSLDEQYQINMEHLNLFLETYLSGEGKINPNEIQAGLFGLLGDWMGWLDFNLSRMLHHETEHPEFILGLSEAQKTLHALPILFEQFPRLDREAIVCHNRFMI
jgi:thiamine kinase-like enzyme